jgi:predicted alpha/beta-hydrolase family hydrolase
MRMIISHGQESGPGSSKVQALANAASAAGFVVITPDYGTTRPAAERIAMLLAIIGESKEASILAGSSMGAYISGMASLQAEIAGLFLLAPPVFFAGREPALRMRSPVTSILHGWRDELIDAGEVVAFARAYQAKLILLNDTHRLSDSIDPMLHEFALFLQRFR